MVTQDGAKPALVMHQVDLPSYAEQFVFINLPDVVNGCLIALVSVQVVIEVLKKLLDMVGNTTAEPAAHFSSYLHRKVLSLPTGQCGQAVQGGLLTPRPQFQGGKDVRLRAQAGLLENGAKPHAARRSGVMR